MARPVPMKTWLNRNGSNLAKHPTVVFKVLIDCGDMAAGPVMRVLSWRGGSMFPFPKGARHPTRGHGRWRRFARGLRRLGPGGVRVEALSEARSGEWGGGARSSEFGVRDGAYWAGTGGGPVGCRDEIGMTNLFVPGQRWISESEPELGLGTVLKVGEGRVLVGFSASQEQRQYALESAPLRRVRFRVGETIAEADGESWMVAGLEEKGGLVTYTGKMANRSAKTG